MKIMGKATARPSLALVKYWGKQSVRENTPATGSLALTLDGLVTTTTVEEAEDDRIVLNGRVGNPAPYKTFLDEIRDQLGLGGRFFSIVSDNSFPTAAGLASSSSGFAALTGALAAFAGARLTPKELSRLARKGSGSATRSIWGGFTVYEAGAKEAYQEHDEDFWPEFRVLAAVVSDKPKPEGSRNAMEASRLTSPYYGEWVRTSPDLLKKARKALDRRDLATLGPLVRQSYLRMFATMFTSDPPLIYWQEESLALVRTLEDLRREGLEAFETMDAGPQVKIFCLEKDLDTLKTELEKRCNRSGNLNFLVSRPGAGLQTERLEIQP